MRLIDCFVESIAYLLETLDEVENGQQPSYEVVRSKIIKLLDNKAMAMSQGSYTSDHYQDALFAVAAFIDEKVLSSNWQEKTRWTKELLQRAYFHTSNAGVAFYQKLDDFNPFNPAERDIREVYFYCKSMGYVGKYYNAGDQATLEEIRQSNYSLLVEDDDPMGLGPEDPVFPKAYASGKKKEGKVNVPLDLTPLLYGGPILLMLVAFFYFRSEILNAANYLVISI